MLEVEVDNAGGNENDYMTAYYEPSLNWSNMIINFDFQLGG